MSNFADQQYLKTEQYRDATNLDARLNLHRRYSTNSYGWFPWIFNTLETLPNPARVLELGCGPADMWTECANRIFPGWDVTLSDLSERMLDAARTNLSAVINKSKFCEINVRSIPYPEECFDIVIANFMLYHVPDRPKTLREIHRVLKQGGYLIAATARQGHLKEINYWLKKVNPNKDFTPFANPFTLENGFKQLKRYFSNVEIKRYDDNLRVTAIEPLMAYIFSTIKAKKPALAEIRKELEKILSQTGELFITKDSGLFLAVK